MNPMAHLRNMYLYFLASTLVMFGLGAGTLVTGSWLGAIVAAAVVAGCAVAGGILGTMQLRKHFVLMQTGRLIQWGSFVLATLVGLLLCGFALGSFITVVNPFCSALAIFVGAFAPAILVGEVPLRGRTWLPVRRK